MLTVGCKPLVIEQNTKLAKTSLPETKGYCVLTATEEDENFLMVNELFSTKITCNTKENCYNIMMAKDDYRHLAPEFEPYLNCEKGSATDPIKKG